MPIGILGSNQNEFSKIGGKECSNADACLARRADVTNLTKPCTVEETLFDI